MGGRRRHPQTYLPQRWPFRTPELAISTGPRDFGISAGRLPGPQTRGSSRRGFNGSRPRCVCVWGKNAGKRPSWRRGGWATPLANDRVCVWPAGARDAGAGGLGAPLEKRIPQAGPLCRGGPWARDLPGAGVRRGPKGRRSPPEKESRPRPGQGYKERGPFPGAGTGGSFHRGGVGQRPAARPFRARGLAFGKHFGTAHPPPTPPPQRDVRGPRRGGAPRSGPLAPCRTFRFRGISGRVSSGDAPPPRAGVSRIRESPRKGWAHPGEGKRPGGGSHSRFAEAAGGRAKQVRACEGAGPLGPVADEAFVPRGPGRKAVSAGGRRGGGRTWGDVAGLRGAFTSAIEFCRQRRGGAGPPSAAGATESSRGKGPPFVRQGGAGAGRPSPVSTAGWGTGASFEVPRMRLPRVFSPRPGDREGQKGGPPKAPGARTVKPCRLCGRCIVEMRPAQGANGESPGTGAPSFEGGWTRLLPRWARRNQEKRPRGFGRGPRPGRGGGPRGFEITKLGAGPPHLGAGEMGGASVFLFAGKLARSGASRPRPADSSSFFPRGKAGARWKTARIIVCKKKHFECCF